MEATLIFPHQLYRPHPAVRSGRRIWLLEDPLFFGNDRHWPLRYHFQKLLLHRRSLSAFRLELERAGHEAIHVPCPSGTTTTGELLDQALPAGLTSLHVVDPVDDVLHRRLHRWTERKGVHLILYPSPNFLTPESDLVAHFSGARKPFMARFYVAQRQRMKILTQGDGTPAGDRWSFDTENRKKLPANAEVPAPPFPAFSDVESTVVDKVEGLPPSCGISGPLQYPCTRRDAQTWLDTFLDWRLHHFGAYEDAISQKHPVIFHSVLTPALNIGLLDPGRVVSRALAAAERQQVPLASIEGFIRQIIGWREFVRGAYVSHGVAMRRSNYWNFTRRMPGAFYRGTTGLPPVDHVIQQVLKTGYCHHIERLMVLGNIFLLCRIHPDEVYRWFMEMFIDAYDWVMVPNVYGMSQFADGGSFTTKPYFSASNYVLKMSDFKRGPWCEIWDALFWTFVADHQTVFESNPRLQTLSLGLARQKDKLPTHYRRAGEFLEHLV